MYKVLLVDDEPAIREGLKTIVNWARHGFEVVGDAANGRDALIQHARLSPDLIVIDIRMPGMDGLSAIREIRKTDGRCRFLILSGYADFTYARQAIVNGVDAYIVKPLDEEEMETELARIAELLNRESSMAKQAVQGTAARREELIRKLLSEEGAGLEETEEELGPLLGPAARVYQMILLELEREDPPGSGRHAAVRRRWTEAFESSGLGIVFAAEPYLGILLKDDIHHVTVRREVESLLQEGMGPEPTRYAAAAGQPVRRLSELKASYEQARRLMKRSFMMPGGSVQTGEHESSPVPEPDPDPDGAPPDLEALAQQLFYAVDIGSREAMEEALLEAGSRITRADGSESAVKKSFAHLMMMMLNKVSVSRQPEDVHGLMPVIPEIYHQTHYGALVESIRHALYELMSRLNLGGNESVMKQVLDFIHRHYDENLKLETLADLFKYNSGYLGKLFKQHTGESFNTYLDKVRIRRAIELLGEGLKVHQVSDRVGYANVDYFHSKFKKYVGMSPSTFKGSPERALQAMESYRG